MKQQKNFEIEINTYDIEKLGSNTCVSMHVITNSNKEMLTHFCEFRSMRVTKMV